MTTILFMGAHYDDIEIGAGGTLLKHIDAGHDVFLSVIESDDPRTGNINVRYNEQKEALIKMGLSESKLFLFTSKDEYTNIVNSLDLLKADFVYAQYENDTHQAHRRCSKIAQSVGRKRFTRTLFYHCCSSINFNPNLFSIVDYQRKMELVNCFRSQIECGALSIDLREKMESYWGTLISDSSVYAEGFVSRKFIYEVTNV